MAGNQLVTFQIQGLERVRLMQALIDPKQLEKAQKAGIRYAAKSVPPAVSKGIRERYTLPAARIKQDIGTPKILPDVATIPFKRKPPTLAQFSLRPGRRGGPQPGLGRGRGWGPPQPKGRPLTAQVFRAGPRVTYERAFLRGNLPFERGKGGKLRVLHGPSIGSIFLRDSQFGPELRANVSARINEQFITGFERAMKAAARGFG